MKFFIVAFAIVAAVSADVSHLKGYDYPQPNPSFNDEILSAPAASQQQSVQQAPPQQAPPQQVQQQYLPPAPVNIPAPAAPIVHHQPAPQVQQQYLPPPQALPIQNIPAPAPQPQLQAASSAPVAQAQPTPQYLPPQPIAPQPSISEPIAIPQPIQQEPIPAADFSEETGYSYRVPSA